MSQTGTLVFDRRKEPKLEEPSGSDILGRAEDWQGRELVQVRRTRDGVLIIAVLWLGLGLMHTGMSAHRTGVYELVCGVLCLGALLLAWGGEPRRSRVAAHGSVALSLLTISLLASLDGGAEASALMLLAGMPIFILHQVEGRQASLWLFVAGVVLLQYLGMEAVNGPAGAATASAGLRWIHALTLMIFLGALGISERQALNQVARRLATRNGALRAAHDRIRVQERALRDALAEAREQAIRDPLTGAFNRRWFDDALEMEIRRCRRQSTALVLLVMDVDRFKRINDRCGHPVGDAVLRRVSALLSEIFRSTDMVCRLGGDEFAVVMPTSNPLRTLEAVDRFLTALPKTQVDGLPAHRKLAMSIGWSCFDARPNPEAPTYEGLTDSDIALTLLRRGDDALYESKRRGGGQVVTEDEVPSGAMDTFPPVDDQDGAGGESS